MLYKFTPESSNAKTGPIPVTMTERASCAPGCMFRRIDDKRNGCYADNFPLVLHWDRVEISGVNLLDFCESIAALPEKTLWRHNVAGDLDHAGGYINRRTLERITEANKGKRGFTYTHHDLTLGNNLAAVKKANADGFTVNASCDSPEHAAKVHADHGIPVVCVVPEKEERKTWETANGHRVVRCPATYRDEITCSNCKACSIVSRSTIIAFPAHGASRKAAERAIMKGKE